MKKIKIIRMATIGLSLDVLLKGQLKYLSQFFEIVALSTYDDNLKNVEKREGVRVIGINMERDIHLYKDFVSLIRLIIVFFKEKPDLIHANTPKASLLGMLAGFITRVPVRIYNVTGLRFEGFEYSKKRKFLVFIEKLTCLLATDVIPEGNGVKKCLIENNITNKSLDVLANGNINGVDLEYFSDQSYDSVNLDFMREKYQINIEDFVFCYVGRVVKDKGLDELVAAFELIAEQNLNVKLLIVGQQENNSYLSSKTQSCINNNKHILFVGFQHDIRPFVLLSNVHVLPSYREGFPNVVLQAGALGKPSIVTNVSGCNEIIQDGLNGWIVEKKNYHALYLAMKKSIAQKFLLVNLGLNAKAFVADKFDQNVIWKEIFKKYRALNKR